MRRETTREDRRLEPRQVWLLLGAAALLGGVLLTTLPAPAAAANTATPTPSLDGKAPYYNSTTPAVDNQSWTHGHREPTLQNVTHYLTRVGGFVVGDQPAQGGGFAGPLILMLVLGGAFVGSTLGGGVGPVGGSVLFVTGVSGLVTANVAPAWSYPVIIFVFGAIVSMVVIRTFR